MHHEKIYLHKNRTDVYLTTYVLNTPDRILQGNPRPAVLICPGGGYMWCSEREGEPIAMAFASMGYHAFVLRYSTMQDDGEPQPTQASQLVCKPDRIYPQPVRDLGLAMKLLYQHASDWNIDSNRIAICGFSAGGHNCAMYGTLFNQPILTEYLGGCYPAATMILGYPLTYFPIPTAHASPQEKLAATALGMAYLGTATPSPAQCESASPVRHISDSTPPTFLWSTAEDEMVPISNTTDFAQQLAIHHVPFEVHIFESGCHGLSLATQATALDTDYIRPDIAPWMTLADTWLKKRFNLVD